jgi:transcriptional regulator with XRE-family HTH domain
MFYQELGERIKVKRKLAKMSQGRIAEKLYVTPQAVSKWERGENAPDIALLVPLASLLCTSVDWLLGSRLEDNIRKSPIFSNFTNTEIVLFMQCFRKETVKKGRAVFKEGARQENGLYLLDSGAIEFLKSGKRCGTVKAGGYFSDYSAIDGKKCASTARAVEESIVFRAASEQIRNLVREYPSIGAKLYFRSLCGAIAVLREIERSLKTGTALSQTIRRRFDWNRYF